MVHTGQCLGGLCLFGRGCPKTDRHGAQTPRRAAGMKRCRSTQANAGCANAALASSLSPERLPEM